MRKIKVTVTEQHVRAAMAWNSAPRPIPLALGAHGSSKNPNANEIMVANFTYKQIRHISGMYHKYVVQPEIENAKRNAEIRGR